VQSNFELACRSAREAIVVPAIPLGAIRHGAQVDSGERSGRRRRGVIAAIVASLSIVSVAAAAEVWGHVQVSLDPSGAVLMAFTKWDGPVRNPTERDFQKAVRALNFTAILPDGLPKGTDAESLTVFGPGAMQITYNLPGAWRRSNHLLFVILANPASVAPENAKLPRTAYSLQYGPTTGLGALRWRVGQEELIVLRSTITASELAHFKRVMMAKGR